MYVMYGLDGDMKAIRMELGGLFQVMDAEEESHKAVVTKREGVIKNYTDKLQDVVARTNKEKEIQAQHQVRSPPPAEQTNCISINSFWALQMCFGHVPTASD